MGTLSKITFNINSQILCFFTWCLSYNLNYRVVYNIQKELKNGYSFSIIKPKHIYDSVMRDNVIQFLTEYFDLFAEWDPTGRKAIIPQICKKSFYNDVFIPYVSKISDNFSSYSYFRKIWCKYFKNIRMTSKQRFSICQEYQILNDKIRNVCLF